MQNERKSDKDLQRQWNEKSLNCSKNSHFSENQLQHTNYTGLHSHGRFPEWMWYDMMEQKS